ncbi:MAG: DNRLRE domain-containing protein [Acidobacteriota bacterium]
MLHRQLRLSRRTVLSRSLAVALALGTALTVSAQERVLLGLDNYLTDRLLALGGEPLPDLNCDVLEDERSGLLVIVQDDSSGSANRLREIRDNAQEVADRLAAMESELLAEWRRDGLWHAYEINWFPEAELPAPMEALPVIVELRAATTGSSSTGARGKRGQHPHGRSSRGSRVAHAPGKVVAELYLFTEAQYLARRAELEAVVGAPLDELTVARLPAVADTTVRAFLPSTNFGTKSHLDVIGDGGGRTLVRFDPDAIDEQLLDRELVTAQLVLHPTWVSDREFPWRRSDPGMGAHRLLEPWNETGATWLSPDDPDPTNWRHEGDDWDMSGRNHHECPHAMTASAVSKQVPTADGRLVLDVTEDVAAFARGEHEHHGWIVMKTLERTLGAALYASRESDGTGPELILELR